MIRINLLGRARPKVKRRVPVTGLAQFVLLLASFGVAFVWLTVQFYQIDREIKDLDQQITRLESERKRLSQLEAQVNQFDQRQQLLQGRIDVITNLRNSQQGPSRLLATVGDTISLTDSVWLTSMEEKSPNEIEFKGMAATVEAVANFITNLRRSGFFENIEMKESVQQTGQNARGAYEFTVTARFLLPAAGSPTDEQGAAPAAASAPAAAAGGR